MIGDKECDGMVRVGWEQWRGGVDIEGEERQLA